MTKYKVTPLPATDEEITALKEALHKALEEEFVLGLEGGKKKRKTKRKTRKRKQKKKKNKTWS